MDSKEMGRRGGIAHAQKNRYEAATTGVQPLTLKEIEKKLPKMTDGESVKRGLELIRNWAIAGLIPGTTAGAVVRASEVWLKAHDSEMDRKTLKDAFRRIEQLERELAQANKRLKAAEGQSHDLE
jgi:hypothetical protein